MCVCVCTTLKTSTHGYARVNINFTVVCALKCRIWDSLLKSVTGLLLHRRRADRQRRSVVTAGFGFLQRVSPVLRICSFSSHFIMWYLRGSLACFCAQTLGLVQPAARHSVATQWKSHRLCLVHFCHRWNETESGPNFAGSALPPPAAIIKSSRFTVTQEELGPFGENTNTTI